jgi:hypothetical protein
VDDGATRMRRHRETTDRLNGQARAYQTWSICQRLPDEWPRRRGGPRPGRRTAREVALGRLAPVSRSPETIDCGRREPGTCQCRESMTLGAFP